MSELGPRADVAEDFKTALRRKIDQRIDALEITAEHARTLDTDDVADKMIATIPTLHPFDQAAGPFYNTAGLQAWLGISRQAIDQRVRAGTLLAAPLDNGRRVYPVWQFTPASQVHPALLPTWQILRAHSDPWTALLWLQAANPALHGRPAADWLTADENPEPVEAAAHADAAVFVERARTESAAEARVLEHPMLDSAGVAGTLNPGGAGRSAAQRLRAESSIIGVKVSGRYLHPAFQFDFGRAVVRPHVARVNRLLGAAGDPWGVASWWLSPNGRLADSVSPVDLAVSNDPQSHEIVVTLAEALLDD